MERRSVIEKLVREIHETSQEQNLLMNITILQTASAVPEEQEVKTGFNTSRTLYQEVNN